MSRFAVARFAFASLIVLPWLPVLVGGIPGLSLFAQALEAWFGFHCERDPARMLPGLAVCARCYGIYLGLGLGALLLRPRIGVFEQRVWLGSAALLLLLDVASEQFGLRPPWAPLRVLTGALFAYPAALGAVFALGQPPAASGG